jgi:hypothetical protein
MNRLVIGYIAFVVLVIALAGCASTPHGSPRSTQQTSVARELAGYLYSSDMTTQGVPAGTAWSCSPIGGSTFTCTAPDYGKWTFNLPTGWTPTVGFNGKVTISDG